MRIDSHDGYFNMNQVQASSGRLSLRAPQRRSLEILANVADLIPLKKERNLAAAQAKIHEAYPSVGAEALVHRPSR